MTCRSVPVRERVCVFGKHLRIVFANIPLQAIAPYLGGPFDLEALWVPFSRCVARGASTLITVALISRDQPALRVVS